MADSALVWDPPTVDFVNLKPGEVQAKTITLTNTNDIPVMVSGVMHTHGDLFAGPHPLKASFAVSPGGNCLANPEILMPNTTTIATVSAELPMSAGNEYQDLTGGATYVVTAEQSVCTATGDSDFNLSETGGGITSGGVAIVLLIAAGLILISRIKSKLRTRHEASRR